MSLIIAATDLMSWSLHGVCLDTQDSCLCQVVSLAMVWGKIAAAAADVPG